MPRIIKEPKSYSFLALNFGSEIGDVCSRYQKSCELSDRDLTMLLCQVLIGHCKSAKIEIRDLANMLDACWRQTK